jgi:hypothetical protein
VSVLDEISQAAQTHDISFLLTGGYAVILHGFPRNTFDLDLIVRRSDRDEWLNLLRHLGYVLFSEGSNFLQFNNLDEKRLPVDLMLVTDATFQNLFNEAVTGPEKNTKAVSLLHLLALKCHAIKYTHVGRIEKDLDDVLRLIEIKQIDVNDAQIREIILRYGTPELYEKLLRAGKR